MASLRSAFRRAPQLQCIRTSVAIAPPRLLITQRNFAVPVGRTATEEKQVRDAEQASEDLAGDEDPNMNGNYPDPTLTSALPVKRQFRDPYADWWDPQERRNYGEPVHEDNDILGIFSPEQYTHFTPAWGGVLVGCFVATVGVLCAIVARYYPDRPSVPRNYEGGLETELGGPKALRAHMAEDDA